MKRFIYFTLAILTLVGCSTDVKTEFLKSVSGYFDYSTVDWKSVRDKYYRPNTADWSPEVDSLIIKEFPMELACEYWHLLQNARTDFHQKSLPLRADSSQSVTESLNHAEAMFDTVFVKCISQEYYLRLFPEMYNETMKPAIDKLVIEINSILF